MLNKKILEDLLPNKDNSITAKEIVTQTKQQGTPVSLRTLQLYVEKGILPRGVRDGKEVKYNKEFIMSEIAAVHILKTSFKKNMKSIELLAKNKFCFLQDLVSSCHHMLTHLQENKIGKKQKGEIIYEYENAKFLQTLINSYLTQVEEGKNPSKDISKFIESEMGK